jgi:hypothetical protein
MSLWTLRADGSPPLSPQKLDPAQVRRALALLADPEHACELRALPSGRWIVCAGADLDGLAAAAERLADDASVYYALNPVLPGLGHPTRAGDVLRRRWLLIEADRMKTKADMDLSATEEEKRFAEALAERVAAFLAGLGWPEPLRVDSGNGRHLLYRVELPNDEATRLQVRGLLRGLARRFNDGHAEVDTKVHNAGRVAKLPGAWARKGPNTPERPHRPCLLLSSPATPTPVPPVILAATLEELNRPAEPATNGQAKAAANGRADPTANGKTEEAPRRPSIFSQTASAGGEGAYVRAALEREAGRVLAAKIGDRNDTLNRAAFALGQLVAGRVLGREEVEAALTAAAAGAGLDRDPNCGPAGVAATIESGLESGMAYPRQAPGRDGGAGALAPAREVNPDDVATIADLRAAGSGVEWAWPGWIPVGVLTAVAAQGGTGKTRFCADLLRRVRHGLPWPDGQAITLPEDSLALWVVSDNHHDEMVTLTETFGIEPAVRINASKADPYGGVTLDCHDDYAMLEARVRAVRPVFVIIDTVGNATDKNLSRQEEAKAFYQPLQLLARRCRCAVLCLTHLNAGGQFLGRRVLEKVRVAIRIDNPDPDDASNLRRRLEVKKSNSKVPPALGVTMGDAGNEYDANPPEIDRGDDPGSPGRAGQGRSSRQVQQAAEWLRSRLAHPCRVKTLRDEAEDANISASTLYRAKEMLRLVEYEQEGRKWWRLATDDERF